ncbi:MAG: Bug family tripartite tricarboxylate transporter substrate binding protein [Burkholderiales bacterium]
MSIPLILLARRAVTLASCALASTLALAQAFPTKPVRIVSPYASGQGPDLVARLFAERLSKAWNQQVIVEARPGANGFIALEALKKGTPDGHELAIASDAHLTINPHLLKNIPYDTESDFTPVALQFKTYFFVAVSATGPYRSFADIIAAAKASPGKLTTGVPYIGSPAHLGGLKLEHLTGTQMVHVPFKENAPLYTALVNDDLSWAFATPATAGGFLKGGRVRFVALAGPSRLRSYPDIPTLGETGGPAELEVSAWIAFLAPRNTPAEIVSVINREVNRILGESDFKQRMDTFGFHPTPATPAELSALIRADMKRNAELIKRVGIKSE